MAGFLIKYKELRFGARIAFGDKKNGRETKQKKTKGKDWVTVA